MLSVVNLNMVLWDPVQKQENFDGAVTGAKTVVQNL